MSDIESRLNDLIIKQAKGKIDNLLFNDTLDLLEDLLLDSIDFLELIVEIEEEFGIEFDAGDIDINSFAKYGTLKELVLEKIVSSIK